MANHDTSTDNCSVLQDKETYRTKIDRQMDRQTGLWSKSQQHTQ